MLTYKLCRLVSNYSVCSSYLLAWLPEELAVVDVAINLQDKREWWVEAVSSTTKSDTELQNFPHFYPNATRME